MEDNKSTEVFAKAPIRKRTIITRAEQSYGRVRCRTAGCQGISFSSSSWVGDLPR